MTIQIAFPEDLVDQLADEVICHRCHRAVTEALVPDIAERLHQSLKQAEGGAEEDQEAREKKLFHDRFFGVLFKAIEPFENKYKTWIQSIWEGERKIIIANLKKLKKSVLVKSGPDDIIYPVNAEIKKIANGAEELLTEIMDAEGKRTVDLYDLGTAFDVDNPAVQKWLKTYVMTFAKELEKTNVKKLKALIQDALAQGDTIPELTKKINDVFKDWNVFRAEKVARTETLRGANRGAKFAMQQSGVVKKVRWLTHHDLRTCEWCIDMDGRIVGIDEAFHDKGSQYVVPQRDEDGNILYGDDGEPLMTRPMKLDYEAVETPPLHALCRCSIIAEIG